MGFQKRVYFGLKSWSPPRLFPHILRILSLFLFLFRRNKSLLKNNLKLKNCCSGKDAYLLATGPSLRGVDLSSLAGRDCFSVSNFMLHPQLEALAPKLHFFAPYHEPLIHEDYINWLKTADETLPKETGIVLGLQTQKDVESYGLFPEREIYYLAMEKAPVKSVPDLEWPVLAPQSSPIMVLPVLHYMGYRRVFLLGCDHNILKNYGGAVENFYDKSQDPRSNATSGENWKAGIFRHLENALDVFKQYKFYLNIFEKTGRSLYHTSSSGWLEFVEYADIEDVLNKNI